MAQRDQEIVGRIIERFRKQEKTGVQIAEALRGVGFEWSLEDVRDAFRQQGYVAVIEGLQQNVLHVSDQPLIGVDAMVAASRHTELPKFVWT